MKRNARKAAKLAGIAIILAICLPAVVFAAPAGKKIFTYAIQYDPPSIDPQINFAQRGELIALNLYEGLVSTDEKMTPVPAVAERWTISKDGLVYTFYLRKNAKWKDGKPIVAGDFLYAWLRALNPKTNSKFANLLFFIKNAEDVFNGKKPASELGVKVVDDSTLQVTLASPIPYFLRERTWSRQSPMHGLRNRKPTWPTARSISRNMR
jgi:oligopeptide transport system substrate-binding protein